MLRDGGKNLVLIFGLALFVYCTHGCRKKRTGRGKGPSSMARPTGRIRVGHRGRFRQQRRPVQSQNWSFAKEVATTLLWAPTTCCIVFASAVYSAGIGQVIEQFHVNSATAASGFSLMMFGFGLGPMIWAPLSEVYGRKWSALVVRHFILFSSSSSVYHTADADASSPS